MRIINFIEHYRNYTRVYCMLILPRAINVHITQANDFQAVAIIIGGAHGFAGNFGSAIKVFIVERVIFSHRNLHGITINRCSAVSTGTMVTKSP